MTGDPLPDDDHVARYCRPSTVVLGMPRTGAFTLRAGEDYLSVNWLEHFGAGDVGTAVQLVRAAVARQLELRANGRLAVLNVGAARRAVARDAGFELRIEHMPTDSDPSHAAMFTSGGHRMKIAVELAALLSSEDVYPAVG